MFYQAYILYRMETRLENLKQQILNLENSMNDLDKRQIELKNKVIMLESNRNILRGEIDDMRIDNIIKYNFDVLQKHDKALNDIFVKAYRKEFDIKSI